MSKKSRNAVVIVAAILIVLASLHIDTNGLNLVDIVKAVHGDSHCRDSQHR